MVLFLQGETAEAAQAPGQWPGAWAGWPGGIEAEGSGKLAADFQQRGTRTRRQGQDDGGQREQTGGTEASLNPHGYAHGTIKLQTLGKSAELKVGDLEFNQGASSPSAVAEGFRANPYQESGGLATNKDPVLTLRILASNQEEVTSRSVEGAADIHWLGAQVGLADGILDLSQSTIGNLVIQSDQGFRGLALSVNKDANLFHGSTNAALFQAHVITGPESGTTWIHANQLLTLAAQNAGSLRVGIEASLAAMEQSKLVDLGGDDIIDLGANQQLTFSDGNLAQQQNLRIAIDSYGMINSSLAMGPGNNWISINSTVGPWQLGLGGLIDLLARNQDWGLSLQARAIAMDHSQLDSGAGNDQVWVTATLDPAIGSQLTAFAANPRAHIELQQIAARGSSLNLGPGDDQLRLGGDVLASTIDLGTGTNQLIFDTGASHTTILMGDGSTNRIILGNKANTINLHGGERLNLYGGQAEDRISLSQGAPTGLIDGAGGLDTIITTGSPQGGGSVLTLGGADWGMLDGLSILNIESIQLGPGNDQVMVSEGAWLTGQLAGGAGLDTLDFSANQTPITIRLAPGLISEPGQASMGPMTGFERVWGGRGGDQFLLGNPSTSGTGLPGVEIRGGPGIDQFLWDPMEPSWPHGMDQGSGLPSLADLQIMTKADGGIGLTDQIGWASSNREGGSMALGSVQLLTPSSLDALGDSRLLPIAPIEQLLAGQANLGSQAVNQLAIGTTATGAELLALGARGGYGVIAHLPAIFNGCCGSIP